MKHLSTFNKNIYQRELEVGIAAVKLAAQLCEQVRQQQNSSTLEKADASPVTIADFASQALICQSLITAFPHIPIVGEEDAVLLEKTEFKDSLFQVIQQVKNFIPSATKHDIIDWINCGNYRANSSLYWTLDPIDGTKGFIRGAQYAIALALIEEGKVKLGILGCPALPVNPNQSTEKGVIFVAREGQPTQYFSLHSTETGICQVSQTEDLKKIRRLESVEAANSDRQKQEKLDRILGLSQRVIQMDSQAKYGALGRGEGELYVRIPTEENAQKAEKIWDHAAGCIVVEQAGGKVTDLQGKPLDFSRGAKLSENKGIVVSNGKIHERVIKALARIPQKDH